MTMRIIPVNFFDQATDVAVMPAAVATMPITNLQSSRRDAVWRSPNLDPQTITFSFGGSARPVDSWGVWPGRLMGARIRVRLYSDSARVTQVYDSGELDVFTFSGTGWGSFLWGAHPWGVEVSDRMPERAPLLKFIDEVVVGSGSITITNGGAMDVPYFEAARFWLGQSVLAPYTANHGLAPVRVDPSEHQRGIGGVLGVLNRERFDEFQFDTVISDEADRAAWHSLIGYIGTSSEVVLSLLPSDATRLGRDLTIRGFLKVVNPIAFTNPNFHTLQISITES